MSSGLAPVITFGEFRLDAQHRRLLRVRGEEATPVPLGSRALDVLLHLASEPGATISKADLLRTAWPDVAVEENSLDQCISALRRALGEAPGENRFIATIPGRGYRFVAVTQAAPLRSPLGGPSRQPTPNAHAFQCYVAGWYALTRPGGRTLEKGLRDLERATQLDPEFALAYAALGGAYSLRGVFGAAAPHEVFPAAREAVLRALELDPDLPSAHSELGHIHMVYDLDFAAGEREFRIALSLDPSHAHALHMWGLLRLPFADYEGALTLFHQAQAAEPLAVNISANIGMVHYYAGRYHEGIAQLQRALQLDSSYAHTHSLLGRCYRQLGEFDRALEQFAHCEGASISTVSAVLTTQALAGRREEARAGLEALLEERGRRHVPSFDIAEIFLTLGETEQALDWLELAYEERVQPINFLMVEPLLLPLHSVPRFRSLAARVGVLRS